MNVQWICCELSSGKIPIFSGFFGAIMYLLEPKGRGGIRLKKGGPFLLLQ